MLTSIFLRKKYLTPEFLFPAPEFTPFSKFIGEPIIQSTCCEKDCFLCQVVCPTQALTVHKVSGVTIDLGRCIFCGECAKICENEAISFSKNYMMAVKNRNDLIVDSSRRLPDRVVSFEKKFSSKTTLHILKVNAGGCGACEEEISALMSPQFNLSKFRISLTDQPEVADILLVVGALPPPMIEPVRRTYEAMPSPKIIIAVGACAISGGPFRTEETNQGLPPDLKPDLMIPGCAPMSYSIAYTLLTFLGILNTSSTEAI